ncbi:unnamed protein product [Nezara viridula]|uniref:UMP/CMP kinase n=1 Tax=Nezara viridula TaxID=85310 RepID=A0A9P0H141_NEZVI|nr:unnamed protein product [Nezara viridula]
MLEENIVMPRIVFVQGCPGAGKGTQCANIAREFGYVHISADDLLRDERMKPESKYGSIIDSHMENDTDVPVEITCELIEIAMKNAQSNRFLIDGYPNNRDNFKGWKREMGDKVDLLFVLYLDCPDIVCIHRCLEKGNSDSECPDNNEATIKKRISTFYNDSLPIVNYYKGMGLVKTIDASQAEEDVFNDIKAIFHRIKK